MGPPKRTDALSRDRFERGVPFAKAAKCNTYRKIFQFKNSQTFTP